MFSSLFGAKKDVPEEKKEEPINPDAPSLGETSDKVSAAGSNDA